MMNLGGGSDTVNDSWMIRSNNNKFYNKFIIYYTYYKSNNFVRCTKYKNWNEKVHEDKMDGIKM